VGSELPEPGHQVIAELVSSYRIYRGAGGVTLLFEATPQGPWVFTPDQRQRLFGGFLTGPDRALFLRTFRAHPSVGSLVELPVTRFVDEEYADTINDERTWYWHKPGRTPEYLCDGETAVRVSLRSVSRNVWLWAINSAMGPLEEAIGVVRDAGFVRNIGRRGELELLVTCAPGSQRDILVLFRTRDGSYNLGMLRVTRDRSGAPSLDTKGMGSHYRPCVLAIDQKGRTRVFERP
jgi:hypothetical protein